MDELGKLHALVSLGRARYYDSAGTNVVPLSLARAA